MVNFELKTFSCIWPIYLPSRKLYRHSGVHRRTGRYFDSVYGIIWIPKCQIGARIYCFVLLSCYILGVMKRSDLSQIFRSERFPANLMSQYINLLSKFEVALPWSAEFLLVPSLLPDSQQETNQPVAAGVSSAVAQAMNSTAYTKGKVLRRQYVMSYVPSGFWPRLVTRLAMMKISSFPVT